MISPNLYLSKPDLATDPVYSEESISRSVDTVDKHHKQNERKPKREDVQISQQICRQKRPLEETLFTSAVPCAQRHTTWMNVPSSLRNPSKTEETSLRRRALCFGCYSPEHVAKLCRSKRSCKTCNKRHPTSLHDYSWRPEKEKKRPT